MILYIQLSNFHEPLFLLITQDITIAEYPSIVRLERPRALACNKSSNNANISTLIANPPLTWLE